MLQRTPRSLVYLSADELGITERERAGLIEVRDDLASERARHVDAVDDFRGWDYRQSGNMLFNMAYWHGTSKCGTCYCIGGFLADRGYIDFIEEGSAPLQSLFYPSMHFGLGKLRPSQAVCAIDHFLAGNRHDCWKFALADEPA